MERSHFQHLDKISTVKAQKAALPQPSFESEAKAVEQVCHQHHE
jgi:hypothetical protein